MLFSKEVLLEVHHPLIPVWFGSRSSRPSTPKDFTVFNEQELHGLQAEIFTAFKQETPKPFQGKVGSRTPKELCENRKTLSDSGEPNTW